ncbi:hypothetical protein CRV02_13380 [Arcobacter sp. CECT 8989]|uniref:hypothetical protein n=1 Tax=Arcobacter sp. CECT 8989 TaxID=2044509 RepID=UPI00100B7C7A|nr:hypothetical protein [Arcobacter sp. CECT 8989]RXJ98479.1 hypothetical protein CRV02_13380 [Arcobacter sp. CECT 8989]
MEELSKNFYDFLEKKKNIIEKMNNKYEGISLGIFFLASISLPTIDSFMNYTTNNEFLSTENISDKDFTFIKRVLEPFEYAFLDLY